jgi:hypothetical protein
VQDESVAILILTTYVCTTNKTCGGAKLLDSGGIFSGA